MKKSLTLSLFAAFVLVGAYFAPRAEAVPAFSRQVGQPCFACHYQYIPQLNGFGRSFKMGGMTQTAQDTIKDEGLDLPPNLNMGVMIGSTVTLGGKGGLQGNNTGNWQIGNDASLFAGGRIANDMGGLVEINGGGYPGGIMGNVKFVYSHDFGGVQGGVILYRTDASGPAYSMDLYNTGSNGNNFGWDNGGDVMINQAFGPQAGGGAEGLHLFAGSSMFFVNVGLFAPVGDNFNQAGPGAGANAGLNFNDYYRVAITPQIGNMDLMIGVQGTTGTATIDNGGANIKIDTSSFMVDAQAQMDVGGMPTQITAVYGSVPANFGAGSNNLATATALGCSGATPSPYCSMNVIYNTGAKDISGVDVTAQMAINKMLGVKLAYGSITNVAGGANSLSAFGVGAWVNLAQNVKLAVEDFFYSGDLAALGHDPNVTTFELRYAF